MSESAQMWEGAAWVWAAWIAVLLAGPLVDWVADEIDAFVDAIRDRRESGGRR